MLLLARVCRPFARLASTRAYRTFKGIYAIASPLCILPNQAKEIDLLMQRVTVFYFTIMMTTKY